MAKKPIRVAVTGAAGNIGYALLFRIASGQMFGADRSALVEEVVLAGAAVRAVGEALGRPVEKLNVGQLGNVTPQLHVHVVGRRADDAAWPGPVWGAGTAEGYAAQTLEAATAAARTSLGL